MEPEDKRKAIEVSKRLRQLRAKLGAKYGKKFVQQDLADLIGVGRVTISQWERAEKLPSRESLEKFEKAGINPLWIMGHQDGPIFIDEGEAYSLLLHRLRELRSAMDGVPDELKPSIAGLLNTYLIGSQSREVIERMLIAAMRDNDHRKTA